jgi:hypothetical protein
MQEAEVWPDFLHFQQGLGPYTELLGDLAPCSCNIGRTS